MILLIIYFLFVFLSFWYTKSDEITDQNKNAFIVILSGKNKYIAKFRIKEGIKLYRKGNQIIVCGKKMSKFMKFELEKTGVKKVLVQDMSTNTNEDAKYLVEMFSQTKNRKIILVTSLSHQRRAFHSFLNFYQESHIINRPAWGEIVSWYSPLLPSGWFAVILNIYKDLRYNGRVL